MTDQITYYAIVDEDSSPDRPVGVFRRVKGDGGQVDEVGSRHPKWEFSPLLYSRPSAVTPFAHKQDLKRELRLLFVVLTRTSDHLDLSCVVPTGAFLDERIKID
jgi:hypothetical protein